MSGSDNWRESFDLRRSDSAPPESKASEFLQDGDPGGQQERSDFASTRPPSDRLQTLGPAQEDDDDAAKAIPDGKRIYDLGHYKNIHVDIDPFIVQNKTFCYVEFPDSAAADKAMEELDGKMLLGREVKCGPCQSGGPSEGINRWVRWSGEKGDRYRYDPRGKRLFVVGLPRIHDRSTHFTEISELFKGFEVVAISNRKGRRGRQGFCFVDVATEAEAEKAKNEVNHKVFEGKRLYVSYAKGTEPIEASEESN
ncbi:Uu.00g069500.m01.CDS01 [Anthostomella pinea]|uniref:Uu.00g069500.m01.CDS01 n=1 Tax=Anthostomella pinea TaxID=933095 RepID=A0AAI8VVD1_9PEZI|nr:Uu.00g069500.m01.CDS01 [Anthostomella pinea]